MMLKLITVPDKLLRQKSTPIKQMNTKNVLFLHDMANTLLHKDDPPGVGLSAIQVGTPARVFMTYLPPINDLSTMNEDSPPQQLNIFINPQIIDKSKKVTLGPDPKHPALEGCLSIPNLYGPVYRHQTIKIKYQTLPDAQAITDESAQPDAFRQSSTRSSLSQGKINLIEKTEIFSNFYARVIQHEFDHLEGILFTDYTINKSPISSFRSLGEGGPLYFDQGDQLTQIPQPENLIKW